MTLWEIDEGIRACVDWETGEIVDPQYLDRLVMERKSKIENVALYVKELEHFQTDVATEIAELTKRKKAAENAVKGMKSWLVYACGQEKFETPRCKVTFRTSESTIIDNESKIPDEYKQQVVTFSVSKTAIKDAIGKGIDVPGAHIEKKVNATVK